MPREEEEVKTAEEEEEIYELYWAQNTSAHGVARIISTARVQRAVWIVVLAACFVYVTYEIYQSIHTYHQFLTTTEISKINKEKIEFPAVTFCNFNRWRKSHLTEEALANLRKVLSVYSYDYVIPELSDSSDQVKVSNLASLLDQEETTPVAIVTTTTPPTKSTCMLPLAFNGLNFHLAGNYSNLERTATSEGSNITFYCEGNNFVPMDGALEQICTENGTFSDQPPLCVNMAQTGLIYSVSHKQSLTPMAISSNFRYVNSSSVSNGMTLCFWMKTLRRSQLGTVLSYGYGDETILSVQQVEQEDTPDTYGIKYTLFGSEGGTVLLNSFNSWYPVCLQYYTTNTGSHHHRMKLYKYLIGYKDTFEIYGDDTIADIKEFSFTGKMVFFNEYESYLNLQAGNLALPASSGSEIANVNMWDRVLSIDVMNRMLWNGNVYSMEKNNLISLSGSVTGKDIEYDSNDHSNLRVKRQAVLDSKPEEPLSYTTSENFIDFLNNTASGNETFNFAKFTRRAGWQLVDKYSSHGPEEPKTLLHCKYRGKKCDSRWFDHKFGAYGNCYTFNHKIPVSLAKEEGVNLPLIQDSAGPIGGLEIMLDIQTWEYAEAMELLGNSELGLKFIVHTPYQTPVINAMGYSTGPGQKAFVGFNKNKVSNLYPPWGKCNPERKLTYADHYTVEACAIECKLSRVVAQCQCKPYYFPGDFDDCNYEQLSQCAFIEIAKINANFGEECDCPIACKNEEFDVKLSYASFPNIPYGGDLGKKFKITLPEVQPGVPEYGTQVQYIRSNVVSLDLYYESMSETETVQNKAMDSTALLGSIGGHLGLFIGCSVLTAVEFLECIIMSTLGHCKTAKRRRELSLKKTHEPELEENNHSYHNKAHFNENGNGSSDV